jgi:hypothetical protein
MSPFSVITNTVSVRITSGQLLTLSQAAFSNAISDRLDELLVTATSTPEKPKLRRVRLWDDNPRPLKRRKC